MAIDIKILAREIKPEKTILMLGAGASIPSGAPSGEELRDRLGQEFKIDNFDDFDLADLATVIEAKRDRNCLIKSLRKHIARLQPTGGLMSIPLFDWASIFTTNYDDLVEKAYRKSNKSLRVYSSNYDFHGKGSTEEQELFKIHGTIEKDVSDGWKSPMVITSADYDQATAYREAVYSRLSDMLFSKSVLVIGQSLVDPDLRKLVDEAQRIKGSSSAPGKIFLFIFKKSQDHATVFEARGFTVCFGGIDELFSALLKAAPTEQLIMSTTMDVLSAAPILEPATSTVSTELTNQTGYLERMFNGRAASFADIARGWTFDREISNLLEAQHADAEQLPISVVLGAAGVGKTTATRIALSRLSAREVECWEHKSDFYFEADEWTKINDELAKRRKTGVLFVDDAGLFLRQLNRLIELLSSKKTWALRLILVSSRAHWNPRLKSAELFKRQKEYELSRLSATEINNLLDLLNSSHEIRGLVEDNFLGFSRPQRFERLKERCDADMFVCMKNIFGFQGIDAIILEEFASLNSDLQQIYRVVAGMQAIGVRVHRELVRRLTGLEAKYVSRVLDDLDGIIDEYTVNERNGIYGWRVRHLLIAITLAKYKYSDQDDLYDLFDRVVTKINPAYRIEAQSINDMCDLGTGIPRIADMQRQNVLLRRMISIAPNLRVPRHRLIYNLIKLYQFDIAEAEIRIFEREFKTDGPILRYKIRLKLSIAKHTDGIQNEDRAALVNEAAAMALKCIERFPDDKNMYRVYLETSVDWLRYTKKSQMFKDAISAAKAAQERFLDPDLRRIISKYSNVGENMGVQV